MKIKLFEGEETHSEFFHRMMQDERGFFHKKVLGFVGGVIKKAAPIVLGNLPGPAGFIGRQINRFIQPPNVQPPTQRPPPITTLIPGVVRPPARPVIPVRNFNPVPGIDTGMVDDFVPAERNRAGRATGGGACGGDVEFGDAVKGQFGVALEPALCAGTTRRCPRGSVLGIDGLCYNKRDLRPSDRLWRPGRKPLLTGGEMRAIAIAAGAGRKFTRTQKRLQKMGMIKKPAARTQRALAPGHHSHAHHD